MRGLIYFNGSDTMYLTPDANLIKDVLLGLLVNDYVLEMLPAY